MIVRDEFSSESMIPTSKFCGEFMILDVCDIIYHSICVILPPTRAQERIELRNLRRVDMDRYSAGLQSKSKKDKVSSNCVIYRTCLTLCVLWKKKATYDKALAKTEAAKTAYNRLNDELKDVRFLKLNVVMFAVDDLHTHV